MEVFLALGKILFSLLATLVWAGAIGNISTSFFTQSQNLNVSNYNSIFSEAQLQKALDSVSSGDPSLVQGLNNFNTHFCNLTHEMDGSTLRRTTSKIFAIPASNTLKTANDVAALYTSHFSAPAVGSSLATIQSFIYAPDKILNFQVGDQAPPMKEGTDRRIKYCLDAPFVSYRCNTFNYGLRKLDDKTSVIFSSLNNMEVAQDPKAIKNNDQRKNRYKSGSQVILIKETEINGQKIFMIVDKSTTDTADRDTIDELNEYKDDAYEGVCKDDAKVFVKKAAATNIDIASEFKSLGTKKSGAQSQ